MNIPEQSVQCETTFPSEGTLTKALVKNPRPASMMSWGIAMDELHPLNYSLTVFPEVQTDTSIRQDCLSVLLSPPIIG